ncbi:hypothetical protein CUN59_14865 [Cuspidothrix issatschenkoi CHARLIE-1]|uniref:Uncharacterized protein n=1 Tax=Cuspidothrix issatschenkoi CHARLIE-1 TaxID=2052836 RepID=A0A2S6CRY1_9CYAN|nr:hypothetical protein CUN59_14865 [Cuspidothrix issatschenkoi CHARLIE-1]
MLYPVTVKLLHNGILASTSMGGKPSMNNFYWDGTGLCFHAEQAAIFTKLLRYLLEVIIF